MGKKDLFALVVLISVGAAIWAKHPTASYRERSTCVATAKTPMADHDWLVNFTDGLILRTTKKPVKLLKQPFLAKILEDDFQLGSLYLGMTTLEVGQVRGHFTRMFNPADGISVLRYEKNYTTLFGVFDGDRLQAICLRVATL